ncbi:MAG: transporter [Balneolaceae bacterium]
MKVFLKHLFQLVGLTFLILFAGLLTEAAAQITTNNALPVGKDKGIFRAQLKIIRATGDPTGADRELLVQAFPVVGVYGITSRFSVFGVVPLLNKSMALTTSQQQRIKRGTDIGIGDARLFGRYDLYRSSTDGSILSISSLAGVELPTGRDDQRDAFGSLPRPLQRGSGSWDPFGGIVLTYQTREWFFDVATSYQINTEADNFEFGNEYRLDGVIKYRLFPRKIGPGTPGFFYLDLESNLILQGKNTVNGLTDDNSRGTIWFVDPGLQYITQKFVFEAAIQLPAVQDLNGSALETDYITTLSVRMNL